MTTDAALCGIIISDSPVITCARKRDHKGICLSAAMLATTPECPHGWLRGCDDCARESKKAADGAAVCGKRVRDAALLPCIRPAGHYGLCTFPKANP